MTSKLFNQGVFNSDAGFLQKMHNAFIHENGIDIEYLHRTVMNKDPVLNEPLTSVFKEAVQLDAWIASHELFFPGNQTIGMNGFNFAFSAATLHISRPEFLAKVKIDAPHTGDLIFIHTNKMLFEIIDVNAKDSVISGGRIFVFEVSLKPFRYGEGYSNFDDIKDSNSNSGGLIQDMLDMVDDSRWRDGCKDDEQSMKDMKDKLGSQSQNADLECDSGHKIHRDKGNFGFN
uniref:Head closure Hc2 n=1 Tax=Ochrobactrum phage ORM_20 TaxID=2985243 RepID=A0A9N6ZGJ4_9VIRU|nr:head closure Hc2 [Ochrobactrum phage ORM_20]